MKNYTITLQGKEITITQNEDGTFNKPDFITELEKQGTGLKPAFEPICIARKPLSEKTVAENCLKWGTGGINIDESRVDYNGETPNIGGRAKHTRGDGYGFKELGDKIEANTLGRFPANLILSADEDGQVSEEVRECFPETKSGKMGPQHTRHTDGSPNGIYGKFDINHELSETYGDSGNASRFFKSIVYVPKASKAERNRGCEGLEEKASGCIEARNRDSGKGQFEGKKPMGKNNHPTVKPVALMEYLINMITPKNGTVLDPFMGSGTTGVACINLNRDFIGIEKEEEYIKIAEARINYAKKEKGSKLF